MPTKLLYLHDSYQKTTTAKVTKVEQSSQQTIVYVDQTLFYPQGGGQPSDIGDIIGANGTLKVSFVSYNGGNLQHKGKLVGHLQIGEVVTLNLDWEHRYQHMQWHTAGHILDQAVKNVFPGIHGTNGEHGISKKMHVEFDQPIPLGNLPAIQAQIESIVAANLPISLEMVTKDEIIKRQIYAPFDLPANKPLRIVTIGKYPSMPDGGTQLQATSESQPITITTTKAKNGHSSLYYEVGVIAPETLPKVESVTTNTDSESLMVLRQHIASIKEQLMAEKVTAFDLKTKYLGKKGLFNDFAKQIKAVPGPERKTAGQLLNELKNFFETTIASRSAAPAAQAWLDVTLPGITPPVGHVHPVSQAMEEITTIFERIGFTRVRYPEVEWDWYAFGALNMPSSHPARDEWETFFVDAAASPQKGKMVLTPHTSNGQVREMERLDHKPPMRMININRTYRRQQDATHTQMFHQFEGLVVDKGINIPHLKGTLDYFAQEFFGPGTKSRIRPFHFQFTEPSFEVDFSCHLCQGTGKIQVDGQETKCKFCKSGWHEVGGAGMIHPNVLKAGGIDPEEYTGFAFGWGVERTYSLKEGLQIDDIRLLYSGDLRFLRQF